MEILSPFFDWQHTYILVCQQTEVAFWGCHRIFEEDEEARKPSPESQTWRKTFEIFNVLMHHHANLENIHLTVKPPSSLAASIMSAKYSTQKCSPAEGLKVQVSFHIFRFEYLTEEYNLTGSLQIPSWLAYFQLKARSSSDYHSA